MGVLIPNYDTRIKPPMGARLDTRHPLAQGLAAFYLLNDGAGAVARDASGNGRRGTFGATTAAPTWVAGDRGPCLKFDGSDYVTIANMGLAGNRTYITRFWLDDANTNILLSFGNNNYLAALSSFYYYRNTAITPSIVLTAGPAPVVGAWQTVAVTVEQGVAAKFYLNGTYLAADTDIGTEGTVSTLLMAWTSGSDYGRMKMDHCAVYSRALSPAEIRSLYLDPYQMFRRSPIELWTAGASGGTPTFKPYWIPRRRQMIGAGVM